MVQNRTYRVTPVWVVLGFIGLAALVQGGCPPSNPPQDFEVDVTVVGQGAVNQSADGPQVTLTAVPAEGWEFASWSDDSVPDEPQITVDAREIEEITVTFVVNPEELDSDGDGVADADDRCPSTPPGADPDAEGCAAGLEGDTDGDGVNDDVDDCPNTPATVDVNAVGCPVGDPGAEDADNDGVGDDIDQCPETPGGSSVDANGCAATERDTDNDGVLDNVDRCANTPPDTDVDGSGCPTGNGGGGGAECGNDIVESGEQCDDGNEVGGDGCSATCQNEAPGGLANDDCDSPTVIGDGNGAFTNVGASTDGPSEPAECNFFQSQQVESDVWYCYTATCTGQAVISLCGSDFDTKMAVYNGCDCPTEAGTAVDCSDDDCGTGVENVQSRLTVDVISGQEYMIRIGGFRGEQGDGQLTIECGAGDVCAAATGSCLEESVEPGCEDADCCADVCEVDRFCCDLEWDDFCASEAEGICDGSFNACSAESESCTAEHDGPGCSNVDCCNEVCRNDPFCCIDTWDDNCVSEAQAFCALTCTSRAGDCFTIHNSAGCNSVPCCQLVCPEDPVCCSVEWDAFCVDAAIELCR